MKKYPVCDELHANPSKHCAALVITENLKKDVNDWPTPAQPSDELRNGTLTFVKEGDRVFGITCWHVIEHFREQLAKSGSPHSHSMRTMVNGFYIIDDRFIRPEQKLGESSIDIAICELHPDFPKAIGKTPIDLNASPKAPQLINHGYAVGFPETMKYKKNEDRLGYRVSMPQIEILAEITALPCRRFVLFSELENQPSQTDYSGMSGGPIFWSTESEYGVFGVVYEGGVGSALSDGKSVYVYGELASPETIKSWIDQLPTSPF